MSIADGWMEGVEHVPSGLVNLVPFVPDGTMYPKQLISHVMQGYLTTLVNWARERPPVTNVVSHFGISRTGRIVQFKSIWSPGRHVGWQDWNAHSIGIEHEGFSVDPVVYGYDYLYNATDRRWPEALIQASIRVHKWCMEAIRTYDLSVVPDEATIITHALTGQPDRTNDPGARFMEQVRPRLLAALALPAPEPEPPHEDHDLIYRRGWADGRNTVLAEVKAAIDAIPPGEQTS